jgi:hypothetical protein
MGQLVQQSAAARAIGNIPPAEAEARFYAQSNELAMVA